MPPRRLRGLADVAHCAGSSSRVVRQVIYVDLAAGLAALGVADVGDRAGGALVGDQAGEEAALEHGTDGSTFTVPPAIATIRRPRRAARGKVTMRCDSSVSTGRPCVVEEVAEQLADAAERA